jgi:hypothetical protein
MDRIESKIAEIDRSNIRETTRNTYVRIQKLFIQFINEAYPESAHQELPSLELKDVTGHMIKAFLASRKKKDGNDPGPSSMRTYRSAIMNLYEESGIPVPESITAELKRFFRGIKRIHADQIFQGNGDYIEGKLPMPFNLFKEFCGHYLNSGDIFSWTYLLTSWNLMCRTVNTSKVHMKNLGWVDDAMLVYVTKSKTNQDQSRRKDPFHIYANPIEPVICNVLALGVYFLLHPNQSNEQFLFDGESQNARYSSIQRSFCNSENGKKLLGIYGLEPSDIGTHSVRKGAATFACSGSVCGPSIVSVCVRAGWKNFT